MAITYPLSLPGVLRFSRVRLVAQAVVGYAQSPYTLHGQAYAHQGQRWAGQFLIPPMVRADAEEVIAFMLSLNGMQGTFLAGIEGCEAPRGIATGTPVVNGAGQTGQELVTDGWTTSQTGILKAGDYFQLGSGAGAHLHKVLADANSDGSGNATIDIWPRLRVSPDDNDTIVVNNPVGLWRLASNEMPWEIAPSVIYDGMSLDVIGVI